MADNGDRPEKTHEELREERHKRYSESPDSFIEVKDLACAVMLDSRSSLGISVMVGEVSRKTLDITQVEINHIINKLRMQMDIESEMKRQASQKIHTPGAMHRFAGKLIGR